MSEQPKKRPWLQFHLSTAVVLMFVAAGLLWLNMRVQRSWKRGFPPPTMRESAQPYNMLWCLSSKGWPLAHSTVGWDMADDDKAQETGARIESRESSWDLDVVNLVLNELCAVLILLSVGVLCEWRICRKERRQ